MPRPLLDGFKERANLSSARALAYLRTSTDEQLLGLDAQLEEIAQWSRNNGIRISKVFQDQCSGSVDFNKRPGWQALLEYLERYKHDFIIANRRDRFARDMFFLTREERRLPKTVQLVTAQENPEMQLTPERQMMRGMIDLMSQYERELIRARTRNALAALKRQGVKLGRPEKNVESRTLDDIRILRAKGKSLRDVTLWLNLNRGDQREWHLTQVARIVRRLEAKK